MRKIILIIVALSLSGCLKLKDDIDINGETMGTSYSIKLLDDDRVSEKEIENRLIEINAIFSNWQEDSEITKLNQAPVNTWIPVSEELFKLLQQSKQIYQETNGFFDPGIGNLINLWGFGPEGGRKSAPSKEKVLQAFAKSSIKYLQFGEQEVKKLADININLSAIAKGYAVDELAKLIKAKGIENFLVEIGGEIYASGTNGEKKWLIGVEMPNNIKPKPVAIMDKAIATSGNYRNYFIWEGEKYSHIFNPKTGTPTNNDIVSVSVVNSSSAIADAYATAMMAMSSDEAIKIAKRLNLSVFFIIKENNSYKDVKINF